MALDRLRRWFVFLMMLAVLGGIMRLFWLVEIRGAPHTLKKEQAALASALERAAWVSPHAAGKPAYILVTGGCPACAALETGTLETLQSRGFDTRVIAVARPDLNGRAVSTPQERAEVAELWIDRDWNFYLRWREPGPSTMAGLRPADGDAARTAVVGASQAAAANIADLVRRNGVKFGYPMVIWWNKSGDMRASLADNAAARHKLEKEIEAS